MGDAGLQRMVAAEADMSELDRQVEAAAHRRNELESVLFAWRTAIGKSLSTVLSPEVSPITC